jgi:hypothetical protein
MQPSNRNHNSQKTEIPMTCPPERLARRSETKAGVEAEVGIGFIPITFFIEGETSCAIYLR